MAGSGLVTLADKAVLTGIVCLPSFGNWHGELVIDDIDGAGLDVGSSVTLDLSGVSLSCTVRSSGEFMGSTTVRIVGGKGGLKKLVTPKNYTRAQLRLVADDICRGAGEALAATANVSAMSTQLQSWTTLAQTSGDALSTLVKAVDADTIWRVLEDGGIYIGPKSYTAVDSKYEFDIVEQRSNESSFLLAVTNPTLLPLQELDGVGKLSYVEHQLDPEQSRTVVFVE